MDTKISGENGTAKTLAQLNGYPEIEDLFPIVMAEFGMSSDLEDAVRGLVGRKDSKDLQSKYESEVALRKAGEETLKLVKETMKNEMEQRSKLLLELEEMEKKYHEEQIKYETLKKQTEEQVRDTTLKTKLLREKEKLENDSAQLANQLKLEESLRLKLEKKNEDLLAEMNSVTAQNLKLQIQLREVTEGEEFKADSLESVLKELRVRAGLIQYRIWENSVLYTRPGLEESVEWQSAKLTELTLSLIGGEVCSHIGPIIFLMYS